MDLQHYADAMENVLRAVASEMDAIYPLDEEGAMWGFELENEISGFLALDTNTGTFDEPTVTLSLSLGPIEDATADDMKDLLALNGDLFNATLTVTPPMGDTGEEFLMLQTKFLAAEFSAERFDAAMTSLARQMTLFFEAD